MANSRGCFVGCMIDLIKIAAFLFLWLECDIPFWSLVFIYVGYLIIENWQKEKPSDDTDEEFENARAEEDSDGTITR